MINQECDSVEKKSIRIANLQLIDLFLQINVLHLEQAKNIFRYTMIIHMTFSKLVK